MSRRVIEQPKPAVDLGQLILSYNANKKEADKIKKTVDDYNKKIKDEMNSRNITEFIQGDIKASITVTPREEFNDQQAIEILRKTLPEVEFAQCVKTREYIDDAGLENLVFSGVLDAAVLAPCTTPKDPTVTLRIGKAK